jgi:hypothetical protein
MDQEPKLRGHRVGKAHEDWGSLASMRTIGALFAGTKVRLGLER